MLFIKNKKLTIILINLKYFINIIARNQQKKKLSNYHKNFSEK